MTNGEYKYSKLIDEEQSKLDRMEADRQEALDQIKELVDTIRIIENKIYQSKEFIEKLKDLSK